MGNRARYELLIWVSVARYDLLFGSVLLNIGCNCDWKRLRLNNQPVQNLRKKFGFQMWRKYGGGKYDMFLSPGHKPKFNGVDIYASRMNSY